MPSDGTLLSSAVAERLTVAPCYVKLLNDATCGHRRVGPRPGETNPLQSQALQERVPAVWRSPKVEILLVATCEQNEGPPAGVRPASAVPSSRSDSVVRPLISIAWILPWPGAKENSNCPKCRAVASKQVQGSKSVADSVLKP